MPRKDKLAWFGNTKFKQIEFDRILPDDKGNWLNLTDNDFETLMPVCDKEVKLGKSEQAIFKLFSLGVVTNRDEWVYDFSEKNLKQKIQFFIKKYKEFLKSNDNSWNVSIKWSESLKASFNRKDKVTFKKELIIESNYRPFIKQYYYSENLLNDRLTQNHYDIFGKNLSSNIYIAQIGDVSQKPFSVLAGSYIPSLNYLSPASGCRLFSLYVYDKEGNRHDNITDWALNQFKNHYNTELTKLDIFHYVYAVLHNPQYRQKYELNLKREFPRIPFYNDFFQWVDYGKQLMDLHLNYETV